MNSQEMATIEFLAKAAAARSFISPPNRSRVYKLKGRKDRKKATQAMQTAPGNAQPPYRYGQKKLKPLEEEPVE